MRRFFNICWLGAFVPISAYAGLSFELTPGPGLTALGATDPAKAAAIMSGATTAAAKWSTLISNPVTLKYTIEYDAGLPALGAAFSVYGAAPYAGVKSSLITKASSTYDFSAIGSLQPGPALTLWTNDLFDPPLLGPEIDADGSVNNTLLDVSRANLKGLGILPGDHGDVGADGTIKFGSSAFDFDNSDGIDSGTYDFVGVALHEFAHSFGFVSGVDTMSTLLPSPFGPPGPRDATPTVTVLELFRYSSDSPLVGPFVPDIALPVPGLSFSRYFSIDGGATAIDYFSTGVGLAGDGELAGHWKTDATFGLMDPTLAAGFDLTAAFDDLASGETLPADLIALDVIGWDFVPEPSSGAILGFAMLLTAIRRTRSR